MTKKIPAPEAPPVVAVQAPAGVHGERSLAAHMSGGAAVPPAVNSVTGSAPVQAGPQPATQIQVPPMQFGRRNPT